MNYYLVKNKDNYIIIKTNPTNKWVSAVWTTDSGWNKTYGEPPISVPILLPQDKVVKISHEQMLFYVLTLGKRNYYSEFLVYDESYNKWFAKRIV